MATMGHSAIRARHDASTVNLIKPSARESAGAKAIARQVALTTFLDELYASALEHPRLGTALKCFARAFDAVEAWLVAHDERQGMTIVDQSTIADADPDLVQRVAATVDSWTGEGAGAAVGSIAAQDAGVHY